MVYDAQDTEADTTEMPSRGTADLHKDLETITCCRVRLANDANCFALSEASDGAGQGAHCVFGVILGTGVGGGLVIDGQLVEGRNRVGGEWGHSPLPRSEDQERPGPTCYCGRKGCIKIFLSGRAWYTTMRSFAASSCRGPRSWPLPKQASPMQWTVSQGMKSGLPGHWLLSSIWLIPMSSSWAAAFPTLAASTTTHPACGHPMSSPTVSRHNWYQRFMAIPVACAVPPGFGPRWVPDQQPPSFSSESSLSVISMMKLP